MLSLKTEVILSNLLTNPVVKAEVEELIVKAAELDRRERGVKVTYSHVENHAYSSVDVHECACGFDGIMDRFICCPMCKATLIWKEVE